MSSFNEPLTVTKMPDGSWITARSFRYYIGSLQSSEYIDVPEGFKTDFASVPRGLWNLFPPDGMYSQGAVLHDYTYQNHTFSRKRCDQIFLEAMEVLYVPWLTRHIMYVAVRIFGGFAWKKGNK